MSKFWQYLRDFWNNLPHTVQGGLIAGYTTHCLVIDNATKEIRPFYEHSWCRSEARTQVARFSRPSEQQTQF